MASLLFVACHPPARRNTLVRPKGVTCLGTLLVEARRFYNRLAAEVRACRDPRRLNYYINPKPEIYLALFAMIFGFQQQLLMFTL